MRKKKQAAPVMDNNLKIRLYRAKSWFAKAENAEDEETRFIALWISFNAAYATKGESSNISNKKEFGQFIKMICQLDDGSLYKVLKDIYLDSNKGYIRILLNDYFTFQPYWDFQDNRIHSDWHKKLNYSQKRVGKGFRFKNPQIILVILFDRIYTLRNQVFHGGVDFCNQERHQVLTCANEVMTACLPLFFQLMEVHADRIRWGSPYFA